MSSKSIRKIVLLASLTLVIVFFGGTTVEAATISVSPSTGVYSSGATFTVRVVTNSSGQSINAAEGTLKFNPNELSVVSANRNGSIFNLWVTEPTFSNAAGTVSFSGGLPSGYTGSSGTIMNVTFRVKGSGSIKVNFSNASVLANDGRGTNVLSSMNGGTYTIQAATTAPQAEEVIVEYVAPANTPGVPQISSGTHPESGKWYTEKIATLTWSLPSDVTSVRTLLDGRSTSVPTRVYDSPIRTITLSDLDEGVSYFHLQFRNAEGWGRVAHYRLGVDTVSPTDIVVSQAEDTDLTSPTQSINVEVSDEGSGIERYMVRVDTNEPFEHLGSATTTIDLPELETGYHTVVVEAFDKAGNSVVGTYSFTIASFEKPVFTEFPNEINQQVIPVIKGMTRPNSTVEITVERSGSEPVVYSTTSDETGEFIFIPDAKFTNGVYKLTAKSIDQYGALSEASDAITIAVQEAGYVRVGSFLVSVLSIIIPLVALLGLLFVGGWYLFLYIKRFRRKVRTESVEALQILNEEFSALHATVKKQAAAMTASRKTKKLTKAEAEMIEVLNTELNTSRNRVEKEIEDVLELSKTIN